MPIPVRQGATTLKLGRFVQTDGITPHTTLTITPADVRLAKNHGDFVAKSEATNAAHDEAGFYDCPVSPTADTNTVGSLKAAVAMSGALPWERDYWVYPPEVYDAIHTAAARLGVSVEEWRGTPPLVLSSSRVQSHVGGFDTDVLTSAAIATSAGEELADAIWDEARSGHVTAGSFGEGVASVQGNVTGSVATATALGAGAITAAALATSGLNAITHSWYTRDWTAITGEAAKSGLNALRALPINRNEDVGGTLTVYKE